MKKLVSLLLVCVMLVAFAVPAFASEGPSVSAEVPTLNSATAGGQNVKDQIEVKDTSSDQVAKDATDALAKADELGLVESSDVVVSEVFDIEYKDGPGTFPVTVVVTRDNTTGEVAAVMCQSEGKTDWEAVTSFRDLGDGRVEITFSHFCTVVLLIKQPTPAPAKKPTTTSTSSGPKSPKTGYD